MKKLLLLNAIAFIFSIGFHLQSFAQNVLESKSSYFINLSVNPAIGGTAIGGGIYSFNANATLKARPNTGYKFEKWTENGVVVSTDSVFVFLVASDRYLEAHFTGMFDNPVEIPISNNYYGQIIKGDYDNDGDIDMLRVGSIGSNKRALVYKNNGNNSFTELSDLMLLGLSGYVNWIDVDNDNDLDLLIGGNYNGVGEWKNYLFRNDGNDLFTDIPTPSIKNFKIYNIEVGDFNNDGWDDIYTHGYGATSDGLTNYGTKVLLNNKDNTFSELKNSNLGTMVNVQGKFADYDNDGDLDLLSGEMWGGTFKTKIYKNDEGKGFEPMSVTITNEYSGDANWGDYDGDGDLDILLSGIEDIHQTGSIRIYRNDGNDLFSKISIMEKLEYNVKKCDWADFNNDGLLDVIVNLSYDTLRIFINNGNDKFSVYLTNFYFNVQNVVVFDQNYDSDVDYILIGSTPMGEHLMRIYNNNTLVANNKPATPVNILSTIQPNKVILKWDKATDTETPTKAISYNLYVKKEGETNYTLSPKAIIEPSFLNGRRKLSEMGKIRWAEQGFTLKDLPIGTYYWGIQAIDATNTGSTFSMEQTFKIEALMPKVTTDSAVLNGATKAIFFGTVSAQNAKTIVGFEYTLTPEISTSWIFAQTSSTVDGLNNYKVSVSVDSLEYNSSYTYRIKAINSLGISYGTNLAFSTPSLFVSKATIFPTMNQGNSIWGDYDNDGFMDVLIFEPGGPTNIMNLYHNNGDNTFLEVENTNFLKIYNGKASWGDFDNDGDLDLVIVGLTSFESDIPSIELYRNLGLGKFEKVDGVVFKALGVNCAPKWSDSNNDGKLDLLLTGYANGWNANTILYINKGNGIFEEKINSGIPELWNSTCDWGDFNNDGWNDLLIQGIANGEYKAHILKNNKNGSFSSIANTNLSGLNNGSISWFEFNNDGKLDIMFTGQNPINDFKMEHNFLFNEGNESFIKNENTGIAESQINKASYGDIDLDGYSDFLFSIDNQGFDVKFYKNIGNGSFTDFTLKSNISETLASANLADIDNDGDLDFIGFGYNEQYVLTTKIYLNQIDKVNTAPEVPTNLKTSQFRTQNTLSWNPSTDAETASKVLTYNVRIGTKSGGCDIVSPHTNNNGKLTLPLPGNSQTNTFFILDSLPAGVYYWSVQTVDASYLGSEFSEEQTFFVYPSAPVVKDIKACYGVEKNQFVAIGQNIKWYADGGLTKLVQTGNTFTPDSTKVGTYTFYANQTVEGSVSLADTVYYTIHNNPKVSIIDSTNISCFGFINGTATASATGLAKPFKYNWNNLQQTQSNYVSGLAPNIVYQVVVTDTNSCTDTSSVVLSQPESLLINGFSSETICKNAQTGFVDIMVAGGTPNYTYNWSNGSTTEDVNQLKTGNYIVTVKDFNGCSAVDSVFIGEALPYQDQEICLVSVIENRNAIIWENTDNQGIAFYNIYRETTTVGEYELLETIPTSSLSVFVDETSKPNQQAYQYKLSVMDTCGNESDLSFYHRTMHLQINVGINAYNLNWDNYEFEGGGFTFDRFDIYRGSSEDNMEKIGTLGANANSYTDENAPKEMLYYKVAGIKGDACLASEGKKAGVTYAASFSNIENNGIVSVNEGLNDIVNIYPNPFNSSIYLVANNNVILSVSITNILGEEVLYEKLTSKEIYLDTQKLKQGTYFITLNFNNETRIIRKIVKQ